MLNSCVFVFRPDSEGIWRWIDDESITLAYFLQERNILIDDDCQFCRIIRYDHFDRRCLRTTIEFRAWNDAKVRININKQFINQFNNDFQ